MSGGGKPALLPAASQLHGRVLELAEQLALNGAGKLVGVRRMQLEEDPLSVAWKHLIECYRNDKHVKTENKNMEIK